jgi:hypothetical protein
MIPVVGGISPSAGGIDGGDISGGRAGDKLSDMVVNGKKSKMAHPAIITQAFIEDSFMPEVILP